MKGFFTSRKFRQGSMATAITVVVVALVVVLNFVATTLTDRYSLTLDLTPGKVFSITDETTEYLSQLTKDVTIYVLDTEESFTVRNQYYLQASEVLKKYALASERIHLEYVDLVANPAFAQNYPELQLSANSILVTCGDKVRDTTPYSLYDVEQNGMPVASKAEQVLTSAILAVTSDKTVNVAVIGGHNEETITPFTDVLTANNYTIGDVNLLTEEIDPVYDLAILNAPLRDFSEDELRRLDAYLDNNGKYGKTLLYFASSEQVELPNLAAFLADWGVAVKPGMVYETDAARYLPQYPYLAIVDYAEDVYAENAKGSGLVPFAAYGRPLSVLFDNKNGVTTSILLQYAGTSGVAVSESEIHQPDGSVIPYLTLSQQLTYEGMEARTSQVVVCGSSAFVDSNFLSNPNFANSEYMLNLLGSLTGQEDAIAIQTKDLSVTSLNITMMQAIVIGVLLAVVLPLVVLVSGLVIWARRRHR